MLYKTLSISIFIIVLNLCAGNAMEKRESSADQIFPQKTCANICLELKELVTKFEMVRWSELDTPKREQAHEALVKAKQDLSVLFNGLPRTTIPCELFSDPTKINMTFDESSNVFMKFGGRG